MQVEQKREVAQHAKKTHYPKFELIIDWLNILGIETDIFSQDKNWQDVIDAGNSLRPIVASRTKEELYSNNTKLLATLESIENYLGEEDPIPSTIDVLIIFGSKDLGRVHKAVTEIYNTIHVAHLVFTGKSRYDSKDQGEPEAITFMQEAIRLGVPNDVCIVEPHSITIADNVRTSLNLLDKNQIQYNSIATMVSWFAQRRAWAHLRKYTGASIYRVNAPSKSTELAPGSWYRHEVGINVILSEFLKMKMAVLIDTA